MTSNSSSPRVETDTRHGLVPTGATPKTSAEQRQAQLLKRLHEEREIRKAEQAREAKLEAARRQKVREKALGDSADTITSRLLLPKKVSVKLRPEDVEAEESKVREQSERKLQQIVQRVQNQGPDPRHAEYLRKLSEKRRAAEKASEAELERTREKRSAVAEAARRVMEKTSSSSFSSRNQAQRYACPEDCDDPADAEAKCQDSSRNNIARRSTSNNNNFSDNGEDDEAASNALVPAVYAKHRQANKNDFEFERTLDRAKWAQRHGIQENTPVFICSEAYPAIRDELLRRGWFENLDKESQIWDFQFARSVAAFDKGGLREEQIINRFYGTGEMCSKAGIAKNLHDLHWFDSVDPNSFFPRCYNLGTLDRAELDDFVEDFKVTAVERLLKLIREKLQADPGSLLEASPFLLRTIIRVANKFVNRYNDDYVDAPVGFLPPVVSPIDWAIISNASDESLTLKKNFLTSAMQYAQSENLDQLFDHCVATQDHDRFFGRYASAQDDEGKLEEYPDLQDVGPRSKAMRKYIRHQLRKLAEAAREGSLNAQTIDEELILRSKRALGGLLSHRGDQGRINGETGQNVWIVKPAGKSRGRGIQCFNNIEQLFRYTRANTQETTKWVVQKYMENSLIIKRRKFDIRQWVLVTSWNPLTIFFYDDCYFRFCVGEYSLQDLEDKYIHLANNSISKHSENFNNGPIAENMWRRDEFLKYLDEENIAEGSSAWASRIRPAMESIVQASMSCVQDLVRSRTHSFEIFGFDFMLDDELNPWLIEINSSPSMEYSTAVTRDLASAALQSSVACVLDYKYRIDGDGKRRLRTKATSSDYDLGKWKLLYASPNEFRRKLEATANLTLSGAGIESYNKASLPKKFIIRRRSSSRARTQRSRNLYDSNKDKESKTAEDSSIVDEELDDANEEGDECLEEKNNGYCARMNLASDKNNKQPWDKKSNNAVTGDQDNQSHASKYDSGSYNDESEETSCFDEQKAPGPRTMSTIQATRANRLSQPKNTRQLSTNRFTRPSSKHVEHKAIPITVATFEM